MIAVAGMEVIHRLIDKDLHPQSWSGHRFYQVPNLPTVEIYAEFSMWYHPQRDQTDIYCQVGYIWLLP